MKNFSNKIAVITGAASGIGFAIAKKAAYLGMRVVLADWNEEALLAAEDDLKTEHHQILACVTDVTQEKDVLLLAEQTIQQFGIPHLLFNNAGVGGPIGPVWEVSLTDFQRTWNINVMGIVYALRAFMPWFIKRVEPTHIINTASMAGFYSAPNLSSYEISKHAAVALSEALHHDLRQRAAHIKVSVLCPGWVATNILKSNLAELLESYDTQEYAENDIAWLLHFARSVKKGIAPDQVADQVFAAIEQEKFYIFTDPQMKQKIIQHRLEAILAETMPVAFDF